MRSTWAAMVALALFVAPWAYAGNLSVLSDAQDTRQKTRSFIPPGAIVKAEFKSSHSDDNDMSANSDSLLPDPDMADMPTVQSRPVDNSQENVNAMAPAPNGNTARGKELETPIQMRASSDDYENELSKDLVIKPPPPKVGESESDDMETLTGGNISPVMDKAPNRGRGKNSRIGVRTPPVTDRKIQSASRVDVRKVRPVTRNSWATPAGSYRHPRSFAANPPRPQRAQVSQPVTQMDESERFVRDGVTIKLAPSARQAAYGQGPDSPISEEIISAATEIIGLPFAFVSSFF